MLTDAQHVILFWVLLGFFFIIGVVALLAILGIIKTGKGFRTWAVTGFAAGVVGAIVLWAKSPPPQPPIDLYVNLQPPKEVDPQKFVLVNGTYEYHAETDSIPSSQPSGAVELTAGQTMGSWTAKFPPYKGMTKAAAVKLTLKDSNGGSWSVLPFYPNYNNQPLKQAQQSASNPAPSFSLALVSSAIAAEKQIKFNNYARSIGTMGGRTYYRWRVFVDEPGQVLNNIAEVQYLLHPTFPDPLHVQTNRDEKFALEATGWGTFSIQISVNFKDRSTLRTTYDLDFSKAWP